MGPPSRLVTGRMASARVRTAVWLAMTAMVLFFLALSGVYLARSGRVEEWLTPAVARLLSANTLVLFTSSLTLWRAQRHFAANALDRFSLWLIATTGLGFGFLAGQALAWRALLREGVYSPRAPNSSFFYLATAAHAAHLLTGLLLLVWVLSRAWRGRLQPEQPLALQAAAIFWHSLDATWLGLFVCLWARR